MNVASVKANPKKPENAYIKFDDGTEAWCPSFEKASALVIGQPLPADWTQDVGEYGPRAFPPKEFKGGGGKAAWANTEPGERFVQERMDRRTALMQATALALQPGVTSTVMPLPDSTVAVAGVFYEWLRQNVKESGVGSITPPSTGVELTGMLSSPVPDNTPAGTPFPAGQTEEGGSQGGTEGKRVLDSPPSSCPPHGRVTDLKPDGKQMPKGKLRCEDCGAVLNESEVA